MWNSPTASLLSEPTRNQLQLGPRILVVLGEHLTVDSLVDAVVRLTSPRTVFGTLPPSVEATAIKFEARDRDLLLQLSTVFVDLMLGALWQCTGRQKLESLLRRASNQRKADSDLIVRRR